MDIGGRGWSPQLIEQVLDRFVVQLARLSASPLVQTLDAVANPLDIHWTMPPPPHALDVTHVMNVSRPSPFFTTLTLPCVIVNKTINIRM